MASVCWKDTPAGYGLISIVLHWVASIAVFALLISGSALAGLDAAGLAAARATHTGIAMASYGLLVLRVGWRLYQGHPGPLPQQSVRLVQVAKAAHYLLLAVIGVMLCTGPAMALAGGIPISWFGHVQLPSPAGTNSNMYWALHQVHRTGAMIVFFLLLAHVGGALWHMIWRKDRTMDKMLMPGADRQA